MGRGSWVVGRGSWGGTETGGSQGAAERVRRRPWKANEPCFRSSHCQLMDVGVPWFALPCDSAHHFQLHPVMDHGAGVEWRFSKRDDLKGRAPAASLGRRNL
jgi:hypothetical protein